MQQNFLVTQRILKIKQKLQYKKEHQNYNICKVRLKRPL